MVNDQKNTLAIDFGTSNSAVATFDNGKIKRIPMEDGSDTLPTAIFFDFVEKKIRIVPAERCRGAIYALAQTGSGHILNA